MPDEKSELERDLDELFGLTESSEDEEGEQEEREDA